TEHSLMQQPTAAVQVLTQLQQRGIQISIDDFGTGYSSLSYLQQYPIDILKIDRSFVQQLHQQEQNAAITKAIISLADALDIKTVAEGIEIEAERKALLALGTPFGQGNLFSEPLDSATATALLVRQRQASENL
ncbi:MAG: EAL domain-containing protein, partial [Cyanobacteria bacterium P01_A01_bin.135]